MKKHLMSVYIASTLSGLGSISNAVIMDGTSRNGVQANGRRSGGQRMRSRVHSPADRIRIKAQQQRRDKA